MKPAMILAVALSLGLMLCAGCAQNAIAGDSARHEQVYRGDVGVTGEDHDITICADSEVRKLSILGEGNRVFIEDGAHVARIEIVGSDNEVSCAAGLQFEFAEIGEDNHVKRR